MQLEISHVPSNFLALRSAKLPSSGQLYKLKVLRLLLQEQPQPVHLRLRFVVRNRRAETLPYLQVNELAYHSL